MEPGGTTAASRCSAARPRGGAVTGDRAGDVAGVRRRARRVAGRGPPPAGGGRAGLPARGQAGARCRSGRSAQHGAHPAAFHAARRGDGDRPEDFWAWAGGFVSDSGRQREVGRGAIVTDDRGGGGTRVLALPAGAEPRSAGRVGRATAAGSRVADDGLTQAVAVIDLASGRGRAEGGASVTWKGCRVIFAVGSPTTGNSRSPARARAAWIRSRVGAPVGRRRLRARCHTEDRFGLGCRWRDGADRGFAGAARERPDGVRPGSVLEPHVGGGADRDLPGSARLPGQALEFDGEPRGVGHPGLPVRGSRRSPRPRGGRSRPGRARARRSS